MFGLHLLFLVSDDFQKFKYDFLFIIYFANLRHKRFNFEINLTEEAKRKSEYWFDLAKDDIDVAKTMLDSKKYL